MSPFGPIGGARRLVGRIGRAAMVQAYEAGLMASIAARAPLHLVGGGLDPALGLLPMPLAHPAPTARPVLLVHGFGGTKSSWSYLARTLNARGQTVDAITYTPLGTSVDLGLVPDDDRTEDPAPQGPLPGRYAAWVDRTAWAVGRLWSRRPTSTSPRTPCPHRQRSPPPSVTAGAAEVKTRRRR
jgi:hypothetical protein